MVTYGLLGLNLVIITQLLVFSFSASRPLSTQFRNAKITAPILAFVAITSTCCIGVVRIIPTLVVLLVDLLVVYTIDYLRKNWDTIQTYPHSLVDKIDAHLEGDQ